MRHSIPILLFEPPPLLLASPIFFRPCPPLLHLWEFEPTFSNYGSSVAAFYPLFCCRIFDGRLDMPLETLLFFTFYCRCLWGIPCSHVLSKSFASGCKFCLYMGSTAQFPIVGYQVVIVFLCLLCGHLGCTSLVCTLSFPWDCTGCLTIMCDRVLRCTGFVCLYRISVSAPV